VGESRRNISVSKLRGRRRGDVEEGDSSSNGSGGGGKGDVGGTATAKGGKDKPSGMTIVSVCSVKFAPDEDDCPSLELDTVGSEGRRSVGEVKDSIRGLGSEGRLSLLYIIDECNGCFSERRPSHSSTKNAVKGSIILVLGF